MSPILPNIDLRSARRWVAAPVLAATLVTGTALAAGPATAAPTTAAGASVSAEGPDPAHECTELGTSVIDAAELDKLLPPMSEAERDRLPADQGKIDHGAFAKIYSPVGQTKSIQDYLTTTHEVRVGRKIPVEETPGTPEQSGVSATTEENGNVRLDWHMTPSAGGCQGGQAPSRALLAREPGKGAFPDVPDGLANLYSTAIASVAAAAAATTSGAVALSIPATAPASGCIAGAAGGYMYSWVKNSLYFGDSGQQAVNAIYEGVLGCTLPELVKRLGPMLRDSLVNAVRYATGRLPMVRPDNTRQMTDAGVQLTTRIQQHAGTMVRE